MTSSSQFRELAAALEEAKGRRGKKEKVGLLARYLSALPPEDVELAARMATGRPSERGSKLEAQVGYSTIWQALREVTSSSSEDISSSYLRHGDLGEVTEELLNLRKVQPLFEEPLTLRDVEETFLGLRRAKGKGSGTLRSSLVRSLLMRATPLEGKYIVKVLTREMRTGLVQGLMEESIAEAYSLPKEDVARAHMLMGDLGLVARAASRRELNRVRMSPFKPVNFMLAQPIPDTAVAATHFAKRVYAEYKYDGVRAQVHKLGTEVRIFSRRLEEITDSFPEVAEAASRSESDFILDGEIVAFKGGEPLPFQLLQRRLRRIEDAAGSAEKAPVQFFAFDLLYFKGTERTSDPLSERRRLLDTAIKGTRLMKAHTEEVETANEMESAFRRSRDLGYEGLVMKDPSSKYSMGSRGSSWVKLKEELDTLDVVIVAAEYGHGKRAGVISDYTFAVRDGGSLKVIGKAYSGLSDAEIADMTKRMLDLTVKDYGYRRSVTPSVVIEVAFDSIQMSQRHNSGYALRFPRIKRIRSDKGPDDVDTLARVEEIFRGQKLKVEEGTNGRDQPGEASEL